jgi:hypothetical protein
MDVAGTSVRRLGAMGMAVGLAVVVSALPATARTSSVAALPPPVRLAPDVPRWSSFGEAVSVSGDTLLVAAPDEDAPEKGSGSVRVYLATDGGWTEQVKLISPDPVTSGHFGSDVAIDGDTAIIGESGGSPGGIDFGGSAYVYVRSGSTWTQQAQLVPSVAGYATAAGASVALQGDIAVVGLPGGSVGGKGAVSVFTRSGTTWTEQAVLEDAALDPADGFGSEVALDGDTIVVGQTPWFFLSGEPQHNAAYVYVGAGADWSLQTVLKSSDIGPDDSFGHAVDIDGDTVVVGADFDTAAGLDDAGSAYVFERTGSTWTEEAHLLASDADVGDRFGQAVTIDRKVIVVSSYGYQVGSTGFGAGAAYVFRRSDDAWTQRRIVVPPDATGSEHFGYDVDLAKNPSGGRTFVSGAFNEDSRGAAYVYRL